MGTSEPTVNNWQFGKSGMRLPEPDTGTAGKQDGIGRVTVFLIPFRECVYFFGKA